MSDATRVEEVLAEIHEDLGDDGVYVDPRLGSTITPDQLATVVDNLAAAERPTYVVVYALRDGDPFGGSAQDLLTRLTDAYDEPGVYYSTTDRLDVATYGGIDLEGRSVDVPGLSDGDLYSDALGVLSYEEPATVGDALVRLTELDLRPPQEVAAMREQASDEWCAANPEYCGSGSGAGSDGDGGGIGTTDVVVGVVAVLAVAAVVATVLRRRRGGGTVRVGRRGDFVLPATAMGRIREAHDRRLEQRARDELLALGEKVDATEIGPQHDRAAWQAALDHYDAARWALSHDDDPEVLDVVGAIVLARRGEAALAAATAGRAWSPTAGCYLDPLHGPSTATHRVSTGDGDAVERRAVPVCRACATQLRDGEVPDVLDVVHADTAQHYFETAVEPWASTGYGSLELDLVAAVQRTRR